MKRVLVGICTIAAVGGMSACSEVDNLPLIFGQQQTVGISIMGSTPEQSANFDLGYKDRNIAIIPVSVLQPNDGKRSQLSGYDNKVAVDTNNKKGIEDTLSVLGQFQVDAEGSTQKVGLGKFFATGLAARILADGFKARLSKQ